MPAFVACQSGELCRLDQLKSDETSLRQTKITTRRTLSLRGR
jgi:hypothetical protein